LLVGATSVNAQTFQCTANAGVTPLVRAEGIAELVGDLLLNCSGVVPAGGITSNIRIFANTTVTSKLFGSIDTLPQPSEALLLINDPLPASQIFRGANSIDNTANPNAFQGTAYATNVVDWYSIPIAAAGEAGTTVTKTIRITNIRANAAQLGVSTTLIPQPIQLSISISGSTSVGVNNPTQTVAWVQRSLSFSTSTVSLKQCEDPGKASVNLTFREGFASAFKARGDVMQQIPGVSYNTESGLIPAAAPALGYATQGTRLMARFTDVPNGVTIVVPIQLTTAHMTLQAVFDTDPNGLGGDVTTGIGTLNTSTSTGALKLVYEVTAAGADSIGTNEVVTVPMTFQFTGTPAVTTGSGMRVRGSYAPISTATAASSDDPAPRFLDTSSELPGVLWIAPCTTTLLFPYVTNAAGFDTGIAISNTSKDPFSTVNQGGVCYLNYYGNVPATGGAAPPEVTTPEVETGEQLAFIVSSGGSVVGTSKTCAQCATPGFHGYIIAICNFQYAHGFAFVSDIGSANLAEGYLALVIPSKSSREAQSFSLGAWTNDGEQLVY
ncbi:MAG: hypothetical protein ABFD89_00280, partial [Bryobacteraceae bacterium]